MNAPIHADDQPSLTLLLIDAAAFWLRNQTAFWIAALPVALLAAAIEYILESDYRFLGYRSHWSWNLLFAVVYALFLDRWQKVALIERAAACKGVDALRRSVIRGLFLLIAVAAFAVAFALAQAPVFYIYETLHSWGTPASVTLLAGSVLPWLPHLIVWTLVFAPLSLLLPALSAGEAPGLRGAWNLGRSVRATLAVLVIVMALTSMVALAGASWTTELLPKKPWAPALMAGVARLADCVLLALFGYVLVSLYRELSGWQPPEPEERPYRGLGVNRRSS